MCVCLQFALHTFFFLDRKLFKNQKQLLPLVTITNGLFWEKAKQERGGGGGGGGGGVEDMGF